MMLKEFAASSNGDRWFLGNDPDADQPYVLHRANAASGGHETRTSVDAFLNQRPLSPEGEALLGLWKKIGAEDSQNGDGAAP